eukprot:4659024-Prymnesium_polylepis.1
MGQAERIYVLPRTAICARDEPSGTICSTRPRPSFSRGSKPASGASLTERQIEKRITSTAPPSKCLSTSTAADAPSERLEVWTICDEGKGVARTSSARLLPTKSDRISQRASLRHPCRTRPTSKPILSITSDRKLSDPRFRPPRNSPCRPPRFSAIRCPRPPHLIPCSPARAHRRPPVGVWVGRTGPHDVSSCCSRLWPCPCSGSRRRHAQAFRTCGTVPSRATTCSPTRVAPRRAAAP